MENIKGKKVLVTGGAGFIGSHLVDALVHENKVVVVDNLNFGGEEYINPKAEFVQVDLLTDEMEDFLKGKDIVFHLAANPDVKLGTENPEVHFKKMNLKPRSKSTGGKRG